ncbi:tetratricopeptide repeat protein [Burkholderia singularis]|uniref:tetratricopeptide repeat protein n=1 Tax=Burkholderia singularis TaxID=1503053 RepID=UPI000B772D53|nr:tetratricopeptide repeat protein [Burkholderia singularis]
MTAAFYLSAIAMCLLAAALLTRLSWWPFDRAERNASGKQARETRSVASPALAVALALLLCVVAGGGYYWIGSPSSLPLGPNSSSPRVSGSDGAAPRSTLPDQLLVDQLAERMKNRPNDAEGWWMLARAYANLGKHAQAVEAYKQAAKLRPDDASMLVDYAESLAIANGRSLEGEPAKLIARALEIDPKNPKVLAFAGAVAFNRSDYKSTLQYWNTLLQVEPADSPLSQKIRGAIVRVRQLAGLPPDADVAPVASRPK